MLPASIDQHQDAMTLLTLTYTVFPILPGREQTAVPVMARPPGVCHPIPAFFLTGCSQPHLVPGIAASGSPHHIVQLLVDLFDVRLLGLPLYLCNAGFAFKHGLYDPQGIVDGVFDRHNRGSVSRCSVGALRLHQLAEIVPGKDALAKPNTHPAGKRNLGTHSEK